MFEIVIYLFLLGALCLLLMLFSSVYRFALNRSKVNVLLNISSGTFIFSAIISIMILGSEIDRGYLTTCIVLILVAILLIFFNYKVDSDRR